MQHRTQAKNQRNNQQFWNISGEVLKVCGGLAIALFPVLFPTLSHAAELPTPTGANTGASTITGAIALTPPDDPSQAVLAQTEPVPAQPPTSPEPQNPQLQNPEPPNPEALDIDPAIAEESPVLQRWQDEIPNVLSEIRHDPSFRTRLRAGYAAFLGEEDTSGITVAVEDVFLGRTGLTLSADYQADLESDRESYGTDLRYYLLPLGSPVNLSPTVGYRQLHSEDHDRDGITLGARLLLVPSRTGAADITLAQQWLDPGDRPVSLTTLSVGYALTQHLRFFSELQWQVSEEGQDRRLGIALEWML